MRLTPLPLLLALLSSSSLAATRPAALDVNEMGRTAATLSDWQTMAFFLMGVIVLLLADRAMTAWQSRSTSDKLASALEKMAEAVTTRSTDINVNLELIKHDLANIRAAIR